MFRNGGATIHSEGASLFCIATRIARLGRENSLIGRAAELGGIRSAGNAFGALTDPVHTRGAVRIIPCRAAALRMSAIEGTPEAVVQSGFFSV